MTISMRGKKIEIYDYDEFKDFLAENGINTNENKTLNFFINNKNNTLQKSKILNYFKTEIIKPEKEPKKISKKDSNISTKENKVESKKIKPKGKVKSKSNKFLENSPCKERTLEYLKFTKALIKSLSQPTMKYKKSVFYYVYLKDFNYYALVIQDEGKKFYFSGLNYEILDEIKGRFFDLYYIKLSILKKYFEDRTILSFDGYCYFEGFNKKVIDKLPNKPLMEIDFMEELK